MSNEVKDEVNENPATISTFLQNIQVKGTEEAYKGCKVLYLVKDDFGNYSLQVGKTEIGNTSGGRRGGNIYGGTITSSIPIALVREADATKTVEKNPSDVKKQKDEQSSDTGKGTGFTKKEEEVEEEEEVKEEEDDSKFSTYGTSAIPIDKSIEEYMKGLKINSIKHSKFKQVGSAVANGLTVGMVGLKYQGTEYLLYRFKFNNNRHFDMAVSPFNRIKKPEKIDSYQIVHLPRESEYMYSHFYKSDSSDRSDSYYGSYFNACPLAPGSCASYSMSNSPNIYLKTNSITRSRIDFSDKKITTENKNMKMYLINPYILNIGDVDGANDMINGIDFSDFSNYIITNAKNKLDNGSCTSKNIYTFLSFWQLMGLDDTELYMNINMMQPFYYKFYYDNHTIFDILMNGFTSMYDIKELSAKSPSEIQTMMARDGLKIKMYNDFVNGKCYAICKKKDSSSS